MRKIFDFHGGIHPAENKHQSVRKPIASAGIPPQLILPLSQHIGAPAAPIVKVGERVLKGQMIAEPVGIVSVPIHAPTSGTISAIEDRLIAHPSGYSAPCIVIACDGADEWCDHEGIADYTGVDKQALLERIRQAGIAGMGGAGFPTSVKLSLRPGVEIDTLILNGTECEPYITADDMLMRERAQDIATGARILCHLINPQQVLIGIEDNKPEALAAMRAATAQDGNIDVVEFPTKYPSGGEKQLIEILTGKQVPSAGLPSELGIVCQNVGSAAAVCDAIMRGKPLISRITTVTGDSVDEPQNFEVLLGTPMRFLLQQAGFHSDRNSRLVMGGPMMGFTVPSADVPVVKTTNCILAPADRELPLPPPAQACIRCGMCAEACPASLLPQQLFWFSQGKEFDKLEQHHIFDCIECGACSYVCPSNIPLVQYYRAAKAEIIELRESNEKAEHSRLRFEARQERIAREEQEKEEKRAARKKAAELKAQQAAQTGETTEADPIQAAIERAKAKKAAQQTNASATSEQDKLEQAVVSIRKRLDTANTKLEQARAEGSELVAALETGVSKTQTKLAQAEQALHDYQQANSQSAQPATDTPASAAQAAIERAVAAREAHAALSPEQKLRQEVEKLQQRLEKSEARLAESRGNDTEDKVIEALESTVDRLRDKIAATQQQLQDTQDA
tara:strand:+ start:263122 stop:265155 length:2034 start_codon:yes stop_codon:yes gene_type:complete